MRLPADFHQAMAKDAGSAGHAESSRRGLGIQQPRDDAGHRESGAGFSGARPVT